MMRSLLAASFDQVVGDQRHLQDPVRVFREFDPEVCSASQCGLYLARLQLDVPALGVEGGMFLPVVFFIIQQGGDDHHESHIHFLVKVCPFRCGHGADGWK